MIPAIAFHRPETWSTPDDNSGAKHIRPSTTGPISDPARARGIQRPHPLSPMNL